MSKNKTKILIFTSAIILLAALVGVTILLLSEKKANKELEQEFQLDKTDLENQYTDFAKQYDELRMTVSNDSLYSAGTGTNKNATLARRIADGKEQQCHRDTASEK